MNDLTTNTVPEVNPSAYAGECWCGHPTTHTANGPRCAVYGSHTQRAPELILPLVILGIKVAA